MLNEVGYQFIIEPVEIGGQAKIERCPNCGASPVIDHYAAENNLHGFVCGCVLKLSYDYTSHQILGQTVMLYDIVHTIMNKCTVNIDAGDISWKIQ